MVGVLRKAKASKKGTTSTTPVSSAGPYQPVAGYVPAPVQVGAGQTGSGTGNVVLSSNQVNPRSPSAVPVGLGESSTYDLGTRNVTLTTALTTDQTLNLPMLADTIRLDFGITLTVTGSLSGTGDAVNAIDHIQLATAQGMIKAIIPGTFIKINFLRFSSNKTNLTSTTGTSSPITVTVPIVGLRLPRTYGPWQLTVFYAAYTNIGFTGATGATMANHIIGYYGSAGGKISRYLNQVLPLSSGTNMIQTNSVPQNVPIAELFISGLANQTDITQLLLQTNGQIIEPNVSGAFLVARAQERLIGTLPTGQLLLLPTTQFTLNSSSEFQITDSQSDPGSAFVWYWLE